MCNRFFEGCVRLLLCSILIQIISKNLHYGLVRTTKLTCEGAESNPGPRTYIIKKTIQASHHQGHVRYGRSGGMQCTSNAYLAIIFSTIKNINTWKLIDLDYILEQGDRVFKDVGVNQALAVDELPLNIGILALKMFIFLRKCLFVKVICLLKEIFFFFCKFQKLYRE